MCKRDLCSACSLCDYKDNSGDDPDRYCRSCWDKGEVIRGQLERVRANALAEEERLMAEWQKLCLGDANEQAARQGS